MLQRLYFKLFLVFILFTTPSFGDILFTNKGDEIEGKLEKLINNKIYFKVNDKVNIYDKKEILKILLLEQKKLKGEDSVKDIKNRDLINLLNNLPQSTDYPNAGVLNYLLETTYILKSDLSSTKITNVIKYVLKERSRDESNVRFYYLSDLEKGEILYARSINQNEITYLNDTAIQEGSEYYYYPQYDKLKSIKFAIPKVNVGSIIDYSYKVDTTKHSISNPFYGKIYFRSTEPIKIARLNVIIPSKYKLVFKEYNMPSSVQVTNLGDKIKYSWEVKDINEYIYEDNMPPKSYILPHVVFTIKDSWIDIQKSFESIIQKKLNKDKKILDLKVKEILKQPTNQDIKQTLYNWVVKQIKYINVPISDYSYIPKDISEILKNKVGNSLDKTFLYYALLKQAGLNAEMVYLADQYINFDNSISCIYQFNQAGVKINDDIIYPVYDTYKIDELPSNIQNSNGFIISTKYKVPFFKIGYKNNEYSYNLMTIDLDTKGNIFVKEQNKFEGQTQASWRAYKDFTKEQINNSIQQNVNSIAPNVILQSYSLTNLNDLSKNIEFKLNYKINDYALTAGDKYLIFKIPQIGIGSSFVGQDTREFPLFWFYKYLSNKEVYINLPQGYKVYYLPTNLEIKTNTNNYSRTYTINNYQIVYKEQWLRNNLLILPQDYKQYKQELEIIAKSSQDWIVLLKDESSVN